MMYVRYPLSLRNVEGLLHGSIHNDFNQERHLTSRQTFKARRAAALVEWREICSA